MKKQILTVTISMIATLSLVGFTSSYLKPKVVSATVLEAKPIEPITIEIEPISIEIKKLLADQKYLDQILLEGVEKANLIASKKIQKIKEIVGF